MSKLKIGVVGAGHLGRIHAKLIGQVDDAELAFVCDPFETARQTAQTQLDCQIESDFRKCVPLADAVVIASPTDTHAEVATHFLKAGRSVLVEKPITIDPSDADRLVSLASKYKATLQVGHVERFNPAFTALQQHGRDVKYVEAVRASRFPGRCLDVGVVMDLMIHDIDLVLSMTSAALVDVRSSGVSIVSEHEDIAECRLEFACGLVANLKASRVSPTPARSMQVYSTNGFADIDFGTPTIHRIGISDDLSHRSFDLSQATDNPLGYADELFENKLIAESVELQPRNAILEELHDFVISIQSGSKPVVDGVAGARAVSVADQVLRSIAERCWYGDNSPAATGANAEVRHRIDSPNRRRAA